MDQCRGRILSEHRRKEMTNSDPSPLHPGSFGVPGQGLETNGGWRGGGIRLGLHMVHIHPISIRELAAAYTRPLGCDLNSKFFSYNFI
jgi:hypothetical protein